MRPLYDGDDEDVSMINSGWNEELPLRLQPWRHLTRDDAKAIDDSWHSPRVNVFPSPQQVHPRSQAFTAAFRTDAQPKPRPFVNPIKFAYPGIPANYSEITPRDWVTR